MKSANILALKKSATKAPSITLTTVLNAGYIKNHLFTFMRAKEIAALDFVSKSVREPIQYYKKSTLVRELAKFGLNYDVKDNPGIPNIDFRLNHLITKLAEPLQKFIADNAKTTDIPNLIRLLLENAYVHSALPMPLQSALANTHDYLAQELSKELNLNLYSEDKILNLLKTGINPNIRPRNLRNPFIQNWPIFAIAMHKKLKNVTHFILNHHQFNEADLSSIFLTKLIVNLFEQATDASTEADINYYLNLVITLINQFFSAPNDLFNLLLNQLDIFIHLSNRSRFFQQCVDWVVYLADSKIAIAKIEILLENLDYSIALEDNLIEPILELFLRLLKKNPNIGFINTFLARIIGLNTAGKNSLFTTIALSQNHPAANSAAIHILHLILQITQDSKIIYAFLESQNAEGWTLGKTIAHYQPESVNLDFHRLLEELVKLDLKKITAPDEKNFHDDKEITPVEKSKKLVFEDFFSLLELSNNEHYTYALIAAFHQPNILKVHFLLLRFLLEQGLHPNRLITYLSQATFEEATLGYILAEKLSPLVKEYLLLIIDLLRIGANANNVYQLVSQQFNKSTLGMKIAENFNNAEVSLYHQLLNNLLDKGVTKKQIVDLLNIRVIDAWAYHDYFSAKNKVNIFEYHNLLIKLAGDPAEHKALLNLINPKGDRDLFCLSQVLASDHDTEVILDHFNLLFTLLKKGVAAEEVFNYISGKDSNLCLSFKNIILKLHDEKVIGALLDLLHVLLKSKLAPEKIYAFLQANTPDDPEFIILAARNINFNFYPFFELLAALEEKLLPNISPISLLTPDLTLSKEILEAKQPCNELKLLAKKKPAVVIRQNLKLKSFYIYHDFDKLLNKMLNKYNINSFTCDVFENNLLTLLGVIDQPFSCHFSSIAKNIKTSYPFVVALRLGLQGKQADNFVQKLNTRFPGAAKSLGLTNKLQEIHLNLETLMEKILPVFDSHLAKQFDLNPLLLKAYQMEAKYVPKLEFSTIFQPILDIINFSDTATNAQYMNLSQVLLKMVNLNELTWGFPMFEAASKMEYADAEAIVLYRINLTMSATELFVDRMNQLFEAKVARVANNVNAIKVIALDKTFLVSDKFLVLFKKVFTQLEAQKTAAMGLSLQTSVENRLDEKIFKPF